MSEVDKAIDFCNYMIRKLRSRRKAVPYEKFDRSQCNRLTAQIHRYELMKVALQEMKERECHVCD